VHSKGLKFGIYEDYGNYTCAGYPGVLGYLRTDAQTFASWDVDYVKLDGCYAHPSDMDRGYPEFGYYLNQTGRAMMYSCSWPVYQIYAGMQPNFSSIIDSCNLWRNFDDIQDSWASVESIIDYYGNNQDVIVANAGPGHWNDPDMLIIGNFGLSYEQSKTQMAIWAILAAPLLMSVDLRTMRPEYKAILQNKKIIAVDQDPLGIQGRRIYKVNDKQTIGTVA
jgi:alpha-N-acetylgalactosaminidase